MFVLVLAVPALLVVVLGYVVGHVLWTAAGGAPGAGEAVGWTTGLVLLGVVLWVLLARWRRGRTTRQV